MKINDILRDEGIQYGERILLINMQMKHDFERSFLPIS
jgi:hypothetical protein